MPSFTRHGAWPPESPVVVSVPHAGRDYPPALLAAARVPAATLALLEDRRVDEVALAAHGGEVLLIQNAPRASIDLNRGEEERDPQVDEGALFRGAAAARSPKVRSGLGLVPRRAGPAAAMLWRRRFTDEEIARRIAAEHRPYHDALSAALAGAAARFGAAVLLDLHSMPPLAGPGSAQLVIGDRFGRTAPARLVGRVEAAVQSAGLRTALNIPYAGGHLIERHADARHARYALQLELDRALYLDPALDRPGPGFAAMAALVRRIVAALADEVLGSGQTQAAE